MAPPGRKSNSQTGLEKPCGPHHCVTRFGSVHALNTNSCGASNTRISTSSWRSFAMMLPVPMLFLLFLYVAQIVIQPIEALCPEPLVVSHPIGYVLERPASDPAGSPLRLAPTCNQTGMFQYFEVPGDGGMLIAKGAASCVTVVS